MNPVSKKADIARMNAILKKQSFSIKFDLENTGYKRVENIGNGAYGVVCSAINQKTQERVAIKKINNVFDLHVTAMRTYREIRILRHFLHDNIISIRDILKPKEAFDCFKEIYVVLDLMESDLHRIIHSRQALTDEHVRYFLYQLLRGLKYIHSANVIHRDLKPSNLLVNEDCQLKIGDFGMARGMSSSGEEKNMFMTQYVATRWYRAPEIMLSTRQYTSAVDMWSVGCIFAEMLGRKHLFPGTDLLNQLKLIIGVLGTPSKAFLELVQLDVIKKLVKEWGHKDPLPLVTLFPGANRKALDLLSKMLTIHPKDRLTAEEALRHPYLSKYHDPDDEPICIPAFNFDFEKQEDLKGPKLRQAILTEIKDYHNSPVVTPTFSAVLKPVGHQSQVTGLQAFLNQLNQKQPDEDSNTVQEDLKLPSQTISASSSSNQPGVLQSDNKPDSFKVPQSNTTGLVGSTLCVEGSHTIQTTNLPSSKDVEMLSARLVSQKSTSSQLATNIDQKVSAAIPSSSAKDNSTEKTENKTISDDTKATLKAALLNARKQRAENSGSDRPNHSKKVTALSVQKERMQKRKEKAERARKKEKLKGKTASQKGIELSQADKELLQRWQVMQENRPPRPSSMEKTPSATVSVASQHQQDVQQELANQKQQHSHGSLPSPLQQQNQLAGEGVANPSQQPSLQQPDSLTNSGFQQVFYRDSTGKKQTELRKSCPSEALGGVAFQGHQQSCHVTNFQHNPHMTYNLGGVTAGNSLSQKSHSMGTDTRILNSTVKRNSTGSAIPNPVVRQNIAAECLESPEKNFLSHRLSDPVLSGYGSPSLGSPQTSQSGSESTPSQGLSPLGLFDDSVYTQPVSPLEPEFLFQSNQIQTPFQLTSPSFSTICEDSSYNLTPENARCCSVVSPCSLHSLHNQQIPHENSGSNTNQNTIGGCFQDTSPPKPAPLQPSSSSNPVVPSSLKITTCTQELTDKEMPSANRHPATYPSLTVQTTLPNHQTTSTSDWVSVLSRQFSKYHVEDIYPPALAHTPKGTGGGYGVGLSLDQEMTEGCVNPDSAPLSASLLADWMDVSGNISARELEAIIREAELTSPMALSYSDLNLPSS